MFIFKSEFDFLTDKEIDLIIFQNCPPNLFKGYVPKYKFNIVLHNSKTIIGKIDIRIGYNENIYYGGNIGYEIYKDFQGHSYAAKACKLIKNVALSYNLNKLLITCNPDNYPSKRTCDKIGAKYIKTVNLPRYIDMYQEGEREKCIYEWLII